MAQKKEPKKKTIRRRVNALNIAINPHPEGRYVDMFRTVMSEKTEFSFFGTRTGLITAFRKESGSDRMYRGLLALFSNVNFDRSWFDIETGEVAEEDEVAKVRIPKGLRPEFDKISFVFDSVRHRMVFVSNGLGVTSARNLMEGLFKTGNVLIEGDVLVITVIQDEDNLETMLQEHGIKQLEIEINLPNADSLSKAEEDLFATLEKQKAKSSIHILEADSTNSLKPDANTRELSKIALTNGKVTTKVQTANGMITRSTNKFPKTRILTYEPLSSTEHDALLASYKHFS